MAVQRRIYVDTLRDVSLHEHAGETTEARRMFVLVGVEADPSIMENAKMFEVLPRAGDLLNADTDPNVILEDRTFTVIGWDQASNTAKVRVECIYRLQRPEPTTPLRGGTALEQYVTEIDKNGTAITTTHGGVVQGGHITVLTPRSTWVAESIEEVDDPNTVTLTWVGTVNDAAWHEGAAKSWLVVRGDWEQIDAYNYPHVYRFTWEFEYRKELWDPIEVGYKDPQTGERPSPIDATGIVEVPWYTAVDFASKFGT